MTFSVVSSIIYRHVDLSISLQLWFIMSGLFSVSFPLIQAEQCPLIVIVDEWSLLLLCFFKKVIIGTQSCQLSVPCLIWLRYKAIIRLALKHRGHFLGWSFVLPCVNGNSSKLFLSRFKWRETLEMVISVSYENIWLSGYANVYIFLVQYSSKLPSFIIKDYGLKGEPLIHNH